MPIDRSSFAHHQTAGSSRQAAPKIKAQAAEGDASAIELFVFDEIGPDWLGMIGAETVVRALQPFDGLQSLTLRINSPGGDVGEGFAIYNYIAGLNARVLVEIDGIALSAASLIAMAGDTIRMAEVGIMMIHEPWTLARGNAADLRKEADVLEKVSGSIVAAYAGRSARGEDELRQMMRDETWLSASEARDAGLVDEVTLAKTTNRDDRDGPDLSAARLARLNNMPSRFRAVAMQMKGSAMKTGIKAGQNLADRLNNLIDGQATEERPRADIIDEMADAAGITSGTVNQILNADINCPPLERLDGFAQALDVSRDELISAAEGDGCSYDTNNNAAQSAAPLASAANGGAGQPAGQSAPAGGGAAGQSQSGAEQAKTGQDFLDAFGEQGGVWYAQGYSFDEALAKYTEQLEAENKQLKHKLSQIDRGAEEPVDFEAEEQPDRPDAAANKHSHLPPAARAIAGAVRVGSNR